MFSWLKRFLKRFLGPSANTFHAFVLDWEAYREEERVGQQEQLARLQEQEELIVALDRRVQEQSAQMDKLVSDLQERRAEAARQEQLIHALEERLEVVRSAGEEELRELRSILEAELRELHSALEAAQTRTVETLEGRAGDLEQRLREAGEGTRAVSEQIERSGAVLEDVRGRVSSMMLYGENRPWNEQISLMLEVWLSAKQLHTANFAEYRDKYAGRDVVLCGAGPTLKYYTPQGKNAVHVALNRAFLHSAVEFDYIFSADYRGVESFKDALADYRPGLCRKIFARQTYSNHETGFPNDYIARCGAVCFYGDDFRTSFARDVLNEPLRTTYTSAMSALQLLLFTHPKRIYLVGIDMSDGHFDDQEGEEVQKYWWSDNGQLYWPVKDLWLEMKGFAAMFYPDVEIISINPVRLKGLFKDEYTEEYLMSLEAAQKKELTE